MSGLRVLITNNTLAARAGSELYVRDLATALLARGHTPIVYSTDLGCVARELRTATVPVIDDLAALATPPDVIHGQHHLETMTALLHFPGVPAVYVCHGWVPWEEAPPRFPRIRRYIAVDDTCRDRLVCEHGVPEEQVRVVLNFVDLERFRARPPLPARPSRALVFSNYATEDGALAAVREACAGAHLTLALLGEGTGTASAHPEAVLAEHDLVFAKGRSAIEALAVGAAVVLWGPAGVGPLVTRAEFERLRRQNFGVRASRQPPTAATIAREIARYDAVDAAEVSRRIRETAGRDAVVDELVGLYHEILAEHRRGDPADLVAEERAVAVYVRWLRPSLRRHFAAADETAARALAAQRETAVERDALRAERDGLRAERDRLEAECRHLHGERGKLETRCEQAGTEVERVSADHRRVRAELAVLEGSTTIRLRDALLAAPVVGAVIRGLLPAIKYLPLVRREARTR